MHLNFLQLLHQPSWTFKILLHSWVKLQRNATNQQEDNAAWDQVLDQIL